MNAQSMNENVYTAKLVKARSLIKMINVRLEDHNTSYVTLDKIVEMDELVKSLEKAKNKLTF